MIDPIKEDLPEVEELEPKTAPQSSAGFMDRKSGLFFSAFTEEV